MLAARLSVVLKANPRFSIPALTGGGGGGVAPQWTDINGVLLNGAVGPSFTGGPYIVGDSAPINFGVLIGSYDAAGFSGSILRNGVATGTTFANVSAYVYIMVAADSGNEIAFTVTASNGAQPSYLFTSASVSCQ